MARPLTHRRRLVEPTERAGHHGGIHPYAHVRDDSAELYDQAIGPTPNRWPTWAPLRRRAEQWSDPALEAVEIRVDLELLVRAIEAHIAAGGRPEPLPTEHPPDGWLTSEEAAALCGLSRAEIDRRRSNGDGPVGRRYGHRVYYHPATVAEWDRTRVRRKRPDSTARGERDGNPPAPRSPSPSAPESPAPEAASD